ncbi:hypothetical protein EfsSVR2331_37980 [Enterococcus faecalis]|nr:hypothetical protein EfsSVR2331_37980 [Enterococcus faecalis]
MLTLAVRAHDVGTKISPVELAKKIAETNITSIQFALGISYPEYASALCCSISRTRKPIEEYFRR